MPLNPFDPPNEPAHVLERPPKISGWWIAAPYALPLFIMATFMNEAGWYGTGTYGWLQGVCRMVAFCFGIGCSYYVIVWGATLQRIAAAPAVFGYTGVLLGILWDHYL